MKIAGCLLPLLLGCLCLGGLSRAGENPEVKDAPEGLSRSLIEFVLKELPSYKESVVLCPYALETQGVGKGAHVDLILSCTVVRVYKGTLKFGERVVIRKNVEIQPPVDATRYLGKLIIVNYNQEDDAWVDEGALYLYDEGLNKALLAQGGLSSVVEKPAAKLEMKELLAVRLEPVKREGKTYQFEMIVQNISDQHFFLHVEDPVASWGCTSFRSWVGAQAYLERNEVTSGIPGSFQGMVISPREERRLFVTGEATEDGKIAFKALHTALPVFAADSEISVTLRLMAADYDAGVCASGPLETNRVKLEFPFPLCREDKELSTPEHFRKLGEQDSGVQGELPWLPR